VHEVKGDRDDAVELFLELSNNAQKIRHPGGGAGDLLATYKDGVTVGIRFKRPVGIDIHHAEGLARVFKLKFPNT
jgi:hypothetical protein